jgi:hypothetical protein
MVSSTRLLTDEAEVGVYLFIRTHSVLRALSHDYLSRRALFVRILIIHNAQRLLGGFDPFHSVYI